MARSLDAFLATVPTKAVRDILAVIASASGAVSVLAAKGGAARAGSKNEFGDQQLELDLAAEQAIMARLSNCEAVGTVASEEHPFEQLLNQDGTHSVSFDPLDGSSIVACNWAVGSIFGVWEGKAMDGMTGDAMVAAAAAVYGPRCTLWICARGVDGVTEFTMAADRTWTQSDAISALRADVRVFAPANLRAAQDDDGYAQLVNHCMKFRYTLRYSGGLVPDVCQIFTRRGGVFFSPVSHHAKAKLRVLYEVMPMALLVESAGGTAVDHRGIRVLDRTVKGCDERIGLCCGAEDEVRRFVNMVCK